MTHSVLAAAIAIGLVTAGCRGAAPVPPLREDPVLAAELRAQAARERESDERRKAIDAMTLADAANLEALVAKNPEDLDTRGRLLAFYRRPGPRLQSREANLAAIRRHVAYLTRHHPDSILLTTVIRREDDPVGYAQIRELWKPHIENRNASLAVLNLASVFFAGEPKVAEALLIRMQQLPADPSEAGTIHDRTLMPIWGRLGALYAEVLRTGGQPGSNVDADYAADVKARLAVSREAPLLASVAQFLDWPGLRAGDDEQKALAAGYLQRAMAIDPDHPHVSHVQTTLERSTVSQAVASLQGRAPVAAAYVPERKSRLACLAEVEYRLAGGAVERERLASARALAEEALAVAPTLPREASSCDAIFRAHLVLAAVAWRQGDRQAALHHMAEAAKAPPLPRVAARRFPEALEGKLTNSMLKHGERETMAAYLEQASKARSARDRTRMLEEAAAIRDGRMPARYQRLLAEGHI